MLSDPFLRGKTDVLSTKRIEDVVFPLGVPDVEIKVLWEVEWGHGPFSVPRDVDPNGTTLTGLTISLIFPTIWSKLHW